MPKHIADEIQAVSLKGLLHDRDLKHLRVRRYGVLLIVESGPEDDAIAHVRFRRQGAHIWLLEMPTHTDGWEVTSFRGQIEHLVELVCSDFPWTLAPIA